MYYLLIIFKMIIEISFNELLIVHGFFDTINVTTFLRNQDIRKK